MRVIGCLVIAVVLGGCQNQAAATAVASPGPARGIPTRRATTAPPATPTRTTSAAIFPFTIEGLRAHDFQSGRVQIRSVLEETASYRGYLIEYPSDGLTITGILQIPTQGKPPFPVIVLNHGYFYRAAYRSGDGTDRAAGYLNRHGYLTVSSDYRSWGGSEVGPSLFYSGLVIDVINLMNAVSTIPDADAARMGMLGHSMGGGVAAKVLTIDSRLKAAVLYSTVSADDADIIARWGAGCIGDVFENELLSGCNSSDIVPLELPADLISAYQEAAYDPAMLQDISAIHHLDHVSAAIQIGFGTEDGKVLSGTPPAWSKELHQALLDAGKESQLFAYAGQKHSFVANEWVAFMERSAHFFDRYLK